ncbi:hypothetical protein GX586_15065 [bacterium]|nr:hypothetical protein [bacterium]
MRTFTTLCCACFAALFLFGCKTTTVTEGEKPVEKEGLSVFGYRFGSPERRDSIKKLHIPRIGNRTREPHLSTEGVNIIISEFTREQTYEVVPTADEADGILHVMINSIDMNSVRYVDRKQNDRLKGLPLEYAIVITADVSMENALNGNTVWSEKNIIGRYSFIADMEFTETRREAIELAMGDLAKEIVQTAVERW